MSKYRTHLLLDPDQHKALAQLARREGRSISELTREIVQEIIFLSASPNLSISSTVL